MKNLKIAIEYDDFTPRNHQLEYLTQIREHYPGFKVTLFTIPFDIRAQDDGAPIRITNPTYEMWRKAVRKCIEDGWIELGVHGFTHNKLEFQHLDGEAAMKRVVAAERMLQEANLPYVKIFKAPHWAISKEAKEAIEKKRAIKGLGEFGSFKVVEDHYYQWNLRDDVPKSPELKGKKVMIAHGHVQDGDGCDNGIKETMHKLMKLPTTTKFYFLSEIL